MKNSNLHVLPIDDLYDHCESIRCACRPKVKLGVDSQLLIVHNAFDRRELFEPNKQLSLTERLEKISLLPGVLFHKLYCAYLRWKLNQIFKKPGVGRL